MKLSLEAAPWTKVPPASQLGQVSLILGSDVWRQAAERYCEEKRAAQVSGIVGPMGVQPFLNAIIDDLMEENGWAGEDGRFTKDKVWVRVTFRHQMSLEADLLEALRVSKTEGINQTAVLAATNAFLGLISKNDARALCSYEKFRAECVKLDGALDFPLFIGKLEPHSRPGPDCQALLEGPRPRGKTVPAKTK